MQADDLTAPAVAELEHDRASHPTSSDVSSSDVPSPPAPSPLDIKCRICNAQPGERCTSVVFAHVYLDPPHFTRLRFSKGLPDA